MNIADYNVFGEILYLEDFQELYGEGSVETPTKVNIAVQEIVAGDEEVATTQLVSGNYYAFDGVVSLDFSKIFLRLVKPKVPGMDGKHYLTAKESGCYYLTSIVFGTKGIFCFMNAFSRDARTKISDIDYLAISRDTILIVNFHGSWSDATVAVVTADGNSSEVYAISTEASSEYLGIYSICFKVSELPVGRKSFQFVVTLKGTEEPGIVQMYSCVYECVDGDFQQYIFSGRLGGYVSFPMSGSLERKVENEYLNADYSSGKDKVYSTHSAIMTQYSGGITKKAAAVLSELLASDCAYHFVNGEWRRIVIEEADTTIDREESLQFCSFKFRYAEDVPVRKIV